MVSIEAVWDRTSEFVGDHLADVVRIALPLVFAPMAIMSIVMPLIGRDPTPANGLLGLVAIAMAVVTIWGHLAVTALVLDPAQRGAAIRTGAGRLPVAVLVSVIEMLVALLSLAPIFVAFFASGVVPGQMLFAGSLPTMSFGPAVFILLYSLVLGIVALVLVARLLLVDAALVGERRGVSALLRSFRLTRGMTLRLMGVLLLYVIVSQVAALATKTVFGAVLGLFTIGDDKVNVATIVTAILVALVQTGFTVLATIFAARLFVAVRDVREAIVELA